MIKIELSETQIEVFGHGKDETCSRVTQFLYDLEIMYFLVNHHLYNKMKQSNKIFFDQGHTLITWDYSLDFNIQQFIKFVTSELQKTYPNTINLIKK